MVEVSRRMLSVQTPVIPIIGDLIQTHPGTISMAQGVVFYSPPAAALQAAENFARTQTDHRYGSVLGSAALRAKLAEKLARENGITVDIRTPPASGSFLMVTAGSNMAFLNALFAITDTGDEVILFTPYYFNHEMAIRMVGAVPVCAPTTADFQPDLTALRQLITPRTRAVVTVSPNNPTGAVYPQATLRAINQLCAERGIYHISDEAYEHFTYDGATHFSPGCIVTADAHTLSLFSLSKSHAFAAWRIGYLVAPVHLYDALLKVQDTNLICATHIAQHAAVAALDPLAGGAYAARFIPQLVRVRAALFAALEVLKPEVGFTRVSGAFYVFIRVHSALSALDAARFLVKNYRVAVLPGDAFGDSTDCSLRISYGALDEATAMEAITRLQAGLRALLRV